jgi:hypothetical protein
MKKNVLDFLRCGALAAGIGPIVLAIIYLVLQSNFDLSALTVNEVCIGIFSLTALAFVAGAMNAIYRIERLPLMVAILIHGCVLYGGYLLTYLLNNWLEWNAAAILVFTGIFVGGYLAIWAIIYSIIKRNTDKINEVLKKQQQLP